MPYKAKRHSLIPGAYGIFDAQDSLVCITLSVKKTKFMLLVLNNHEASNVQTLDPQQEPQTQEGNSEGGA